MENSQLIDAFYNLAKPSAVFEDASSFDLQVKQFYMLLKDKRRSSIENDVLYLENVELAMDNVCSHLTLECLQSLSSQKRSWIKDIFCLAPPRESLKCLSNAIVTVSR